MVTPAEDVYTGLLWDQVSYAWRKSIAQRCSIATSRLHLFGLREGLELDFVVCGRVI